MSEIEREFELERMILFSDAVFAIALTLMAIDVKWPDFPADLRGVDVRKLMHPTVLQFFVFLISFIFVGRAWKTHLRLFRQLKQYNQFLLNLNLLYLLFIVIFPFTASGMFGHVRDGFPYPFLLYIFNLTGVAVSDLLMTRYILKVKPSLATEGEPVEKNFIFVRAKYNAVAAALVFCIMTIVAILYPGNTDYIAYSFCVYPIAVTISNRKIKKVERSAKAAVLPPGVADPQEPANLDAAVDLDTTLDTPEPPST